MKVLMGVDFGTGGCKVTVIDLQGTVVASAFKEYSSEYKKPGWSEQDPALWINALLETVPKAMKAVKKEEAELLALAVTASTHNAVLLDAENRVLRPCIMWNDQRSGKQADYLKEHYGDRIFEIGMQMPTPTWTLPQLLWVKENELEIFSKIKRLMFTKDYVRSWITGDQCTDVVDAQGSLLFDAHRNQWSEELCAMIGLNPAVLPEIRQSAEIVGTVQKEPAQKLDLPEGLPVIAGCSDTAAEDYGAGACRAGQIIVKLATAGNVNLVTDRGIQHKKAFAYPYAVPGKWYTVTATNSCASANRWLRDTFYPFEKQCSEKLGANVYEYMGRQAEEINIGADGLFFHPYLLGERCPYFNPNAKAGFFGISMLHKKGHFARALLEGVAYSLYDCLLVLKELTADLDDIVIIGGGAKSPLWCQIVSDVFGLQVKAPENAESSFGGAMLAGVGVGAFSNEEEAVKCCVRMKKTYFPDPKAHKIYMRHFEIYHKIIDASTSIWQELAELLKNEEAEKTGERNGRA